MQRQRGELVPIEEVVVGLGGPLKELREASPQARHHFTVADQVNQLVSASELDPDLGFMARLMALCCLPRTNPGNRKEYVRRNGPYKLGMTAGIDNKLPYGTIPRLLLAWVSTEAVRTQSRELILGRSLSEFMRKLNIYSTSGGSRGDRTRLRNQMRRLFNAHVQLVYEDKLGEANVSSSVAGGLQKRTVLQPFGPGRIFKDLGVAKRYCRINVISDRFLQRHPESVPLPPAYGQLHREARPTRLEDRTLGRWGASSIN